MEITRIRGASPESIAEKLSSALKNKGYRSFVGAKGSKVMIQTVRLSNDYIQKYGRNVSPFTGRRGNVLGWKNWVEVNNTVNDVLDEMKVSANAKSLNGLFKIRNGDKRFNETDWENCCGYRNVGSMVRPIMAIDAWRPEFPERVSKKLGEVV